MKKARIETEAKSDNWQVFVEAVKRYANQELAGQTGLALMLLADQVDLEAVSRGSGRRFVSEAGTPVLPRYEVRMPRFPELKYQTQRIFESVVAESLGISQSIFSIGNAAEAVGLNVPNAKDGEALIISSPDRPVSLWMADILVLPVGKVYINKSVRYDPLTMQLVLDKESGKANYDWMADINLPSAGWLEGFDWFDPLTLRLIENGQGGSNRDDWLEAELSRLNHLFNLSTKLVVELMAANSEIGKWLTVMADWANTGATRRAVGKINREEEIILSQSIRLMCATMGEVLRLHQRTEGKLLSEPLLRTLALAGVRSLTYSNRGGGGLVPYPGGLRQLITDLSDGK